VKQLFLNILFVGCFASALNAQTPGDDCSGALSLCGGNQMHYNNIGATTEICTGCADGNVAIGTFCYKVNNSVWFSFTTNSIGGNADVVISNISCLTGGGMDNALTAAVFSATTPCNPATYAMLQCVSASFSLSQTISLTGLSPSTTYYVHIDGDDLGAGITSPAECDFDIEVDGPAVTPDINTVIVSASCAGNDGQISVGTVTGATAPMQFAINGGAFQASNTFNGLAAGTYDLEISSANGCTYNTQVTVPLTGGPQDGIPAIVNATCGNADGQIDINGVSGGTGPYMYSLNGGAPQASNSFPLVPAGLYDVTVTDATGCSFTYTGINVSSAGSIASATFTITQPTCDIPTGTIVVTPVGGAAPYTYSINGGAPQASNTFGGLAPGTYSVLITDNGGCTYEDANIVLDPVVQNQTAQVSISPSTVSICQGSTVDFDAIYSNGGTAPVLQWQVNGSNVGSGGVTFSTSTLNNGDVVTVILTSNSPCVSTTTVTSNSVTVTVTPQVNPVITIASSSTTVCEAGFVQTTANVVGCSNGGTYYWYVNGIMVDSTSGATFITPLFSNSEIICTFQCSDPCANPASSNSLDIAVTQVLADAGPNQQIGKGESAQLSGNGTGTNFVWSPSAGMDDPTSLTPVVSPTKSTTYMLVASNGSCTDTDYVTIVVTDLIVIPNTFTPNGDKVNDVWHISRIENFPSCKVIVYDRWGQRVYNSTGYKNDNAWDGTYLNKPLPAAAYYYVIELNGANTKDADTFYGWVSIIY
jgi:gliding motility-associated-like protein